MPLILASIYSAAFETFTAWGHWLRLSFPLRLVWFLKFVVYDVLGGSVLETDPLIPWGLRGLSPFCQYRQLWFFQKKDKNNFMIYLLYIFIWTCDTNWKFVQLKAFLISRLTRMHKLCVLGLLFNSCLALFVTICRNSQVLLLHGIRTHWTRDHPRFICFLNKRDLRKAHPTYFRIFVRLFFRFGD